MLSSGKRMYSHCIVTAGYSVYWFCTSVFIVVNVVTIVVALCSFGNWEENIVLFTKKRRESLRTCRVKRKQATNNWKN